jgi:glycosyltransferase involved in cell wall biosynthesis
VLAVGRLCKQKGFSFLLRVFAKLRKTRRVKLLILGEGKERERLQIEIEELGLGSHVNMPGFVADPFAYLRSSSVFALTSIYEPFGLVVVEALSTGVPVVCTETEGTRDILNHPELGALVPFGEIKGFAAALEAALDNPNENISERIARAVDFSPNRVALQYLTLMESGFQGINLQNKPGN